MLVSLISGSPAAAGNATTAAHEPVAKAAKAAEARPPPREPLRAELEQAVKTLNKLPAIEAQDVRFSIDEDTGRTVVKVIDVATDTVLRQIPNAEALALSRSLDKMQGLLLRDKA